MSRARPADFGRVLKTLSPLRESPAGRLDVRILAILAVLEDRARARGPVKRRRVRIAAEPAEATS